MRKKSDAQLDKEIAAILAKPRGPRSMDPETIRNAVYAVDNRPGSEDLTRAEWCEEVRGLLRHGGASTDKLIDLYSRRFHGGE
jgi:hypothetical protein